MDLHAHEPADNLCWICQESVETGGMNRVWINEETSLPIHASCWKSIPPEHRAALAYRVSRDTGPLAKSQHDALESFINALRDHHGGTDLPFLRN